MAAENFLPPEFFLPLDAFDAVRHTLHSLPEEDGLAAPFLAVQTAQTQVVLDAINSQLSTRVMRSYGAFVHGMAQVQQLESDLVLTAILCRSARRHLSRVQGSLVHGGLGLLAKLRRRRVMERLVVTLHTLAALSDGLGTLERLLKPPSNVGQLPYARSAAARVTRSAAARTLRCGSNSHSSPGGTLSSLVPANHSRAQGRGGAVAALQEMAWGPKRILDLKGDRSGEFALALGAREDEKTRLHSDRRRPPGLRSLLRQRLSKASDKLGANVIKVLQSACIVFDAVAYDAALSTAVRVLEQNKGGCVAQRVRLIALLRLLRRRGSAAGRVGEDRGRGRHSSVRRPARPLPHPRIFVATGRGSARLFRRRHQVVYQAGVPLASPPTSLSTRPLVHPSVPSCIRHTDPTTRGLVWQVLNAHVLQAENRKGVKAGYRSQVCAYTHMHMHMHIHMLTCVHACVHAYVHAWCVRACARACVRASIRPCGRPCVRARPQREAELDAAKYKDVCGKLAEECARGGRNAYALHKPFHCPSMVPQVL